MGRDLILRVFLKVLNELQGYSGTPHIAHGAESKGRAVFVLSRKAIWPELGQERTPRSTGMSRLGQ
jgi:hypothetical protein